MRAIDKYDHKANQKAVIAAREVYHKVWTSACNFDNISSTNKFIIFSNDNLFVLFIDRAYQELIKRISEYQAGGYVGLKIKTNTIEENRQIKIQRVKELREQLILLES